MVSPIGLPYSDASFDYVHLRFLALDVPATQWQHVIAELFRVCKPGGWVEVCETDGMVRQPSPASEIVNGWMSHVAAEDGVLLQDVGTLDALMARTGFSDVNVRGLRYPLGDWAGAVGTVKYRVYRGVVEANRARVLSCVDITDEQLDHMLEEQADSLEQHQSHVMHYVYTAQRPINSSVLALPFIAPGSSPTARSSHLGPR
ncbi:hypothetical protein THASP1DRAFT_17189 [Thamnocephalis sphaerospora]|uniref:Methyltransferase type 11 domain-containing protein n=1 Tax=Thamnocephalis sphaerospora TaxID=78915 RepID=A0A4P9XN45_9FUNG|nr:hypothetical protein THASP1DRAFT_17189 [Thamnocephalis sphaerospora]|eukprot:RKP07354.1 hypothetical protein THASP1DRAFT_17189 [Thamnocephalis sphaerospora]